jgi:hypothetical protein
MLFESIGSRSIAKIDGPEIISRITNLMERQQMKRLRAAERLSLDTERLKIAPKRVCPALARKAKDIK